MANEFIPANEVLGLFLPVADRWVSVIRQHARANLPRTVGTTIVFANPFGRDLLPVKAVRDSDGEISWYHGY